MGRLTLANFRSELEDIGGSRFGAVTTRLDLWVNMAIDEIAGAVRFKKLMEIDSKNTTSGARTITLETDVIGISAVWDTTNDKRLLWVDEENFMRHDVDTEGIPRIYTHIGSTMYVWPTPDGVYALNILQRIEATGLSQTSDKTQFSNQWDWAVLCMAAHYMFMSLEELEQGALWFNRALAQISSRTLDDELDDDSTSLPVEIAKSFEDLSDMRTSGFFNG